MRLSSPDTLQLITAATRAPSGHNSQPWYFEINANEIAIFPDPARALPAVDGNRRELFISLGCAAENLCLQASALHYAAQTEISGDGSIRIQVQKSDSIIPSPLSAYIEQRQTNRSTYNHKIIPEDILRAILEEWAGNEIKIHLFKKDDSAFKLLTEAVTQGNEAQMNDSAFKAELLSWVRFNKKHAESTGDGLSYAALGAPSLPRWISEPIVKSMLNGKSQNKSDLKKIASSSHLALITSPADDVFSWISTGRALQRFLLSLTRAGIASAYLNQPCEVAEIRGKLREKLFHATREYPQLLLRIGYAKPLPRAGRRPLREVMKSEHGMAY